jgi:hypothetical protein
VPFAEEAKFFVESRLLQRDVESMLESVNNNNFVGSVLHTVSLFHDYQFITLHINHELSFEAMKVDGNF